MNSHRSKSIRRIGKNLDLHNKQLIYSVKKNVDDKQIKNKREIDKKTAQMEYRKVMGEYGLLRVEEPKNTNLKDTNPNKKIVEEKYILQNKPISIIITAYQTQDFIEECLDSIENQTYFFDNNSFEVLVGVDACQDTLNKLLKISHKYRNLHIFMMKDNKGTYVTTNTLLDLAKYENILRFDSDDVMIPEMIKDIIDYIDDYDVIKFKSCEFKENINNIINDSYIYSDGIILFKKYIFDLAGGYSDWRCAADSELLSRISNKFKIREIEAGEKYLFYRRIHDNSLTSGIDTGYKSKLRNKYKKLIRNYRINENIKIKKVVNEYAEIAIEKNINKKQLLSGISFCIPAYKSQKYIEECLDSIQNQSCEKEILVGVDGCVDTLIKIKEIGFKYRNLRVFWFPQNVGTSIIKNTLATYAHYDIISFFDSDDIMNDQYSEFVLKNIKNNNLIRFFYQDFDDKKIIDRNWCALGVMSIYKDNFLKLNGFWEYRVTEDWDFVERWKKMGIDNQIRFFGTKRRLHDNNISYNSNTGSYGDYGKKLLSISKERCDSGKISNDKMIISKCEEIHSTINDYFDHIYCLNLDRRKDKWLKVKERFDKLKIKVERFSGIDGNNLSENELKKYNKINKSEIGCMLSHYNIINDAKKNNYEKILVFEDDIIFIENFHIHFENKISKLNNWKLLYLGASQWQWNNIEFIKDFYYTNNSDGIFALAIHKSMYDEILATANDVTKPIDYKLWETQKKYYKQCYTCFPNLIIADVSDSDIRNKRDNIEHAVRMRWDLSLYK